MSSTSSPGAPAMPAPAASSPPSFYKRDLPPTCIDFASQEGKRLFKAALDEGNMESYFRLASQFTTQSEPAFCGLGTLCMVLNALGVDPQRQWKGPWRWFEDSMLDCCRPLDQVKKSGITLSEFGCLAVCNGLVAKVHRADTVSATHFLRDIQHTSTQEDKVLCVSYHRGTLGQTGAGHFSPIAGYCAQRNMVLLMDVARFKYPPHWVSVDLLWSALLPHDAETGKPRGYVILHRRDLADGLLSTPLLKLALDGSTVSTLVRTLHHLPLSLAAHNLQSMDEAMGLILKTMPTHLLAMVQERTVEDFAGNACELASEPARCGSESTCPNAAVAAAAGTGDDRSEEERTSALDTFHSTYKRQLALLLTGVQETRMYAHVSRAHVPGTSGARDRALITLLLLALPMGDAAPLHVSASLANAWTLTWSLDHSPELVKLEVQRLRGQVDALVKTWCDECGMTREEGEQRGKCGKRKREAGSDEECQEKRVRTNDQDLSFTPSPSPEADADGHVVCCCTKREESTTNSAPSTCLCCQGRG